MSRMLAAKASLACRVDALGEETNTDLGIEHRAKVRKIDTFASNLMLNDELQWLNL